jgi:hypothetical protein
MKVCDIKRLGLLRDKTIEEMEVDLGALVVHEEFLRPDSIFYAGTDYRERAINRLITMKEHFATDANIGYVFRKKYFSVACPYCETVMQAARSGSAGGSESDTHDCSVCGARIIIEYPSEHAVYVIPPREDRVQSIGQGGA